MNFRNLSSWREQTIHIKGGLNTVDFIDTNPNMFIIQNPTSYPLKVGIGKSPSANNYEFLIAKNSVMPIGRPLPVSQIYIWHDGNTEHDISVYSIAQEFDISVLQNAIMNMECVVDTDGIVKGFAPNVSLPSGVNNIGSVKLSEFDVLAKTFLHAEMLQLSQDIRAKLPELITTPSTMNGTYTINDTSGVTLENNGAVIFDKIEIITNNSDKDIDAQIYYNDTDFVPIHIIGHDFFSGLEMPCVRIIFNVDSSVISDETVTIFGYVKGA